MHLRKKESGPLQSHFDAQQAVTHSKETVVKTNKACDKKEAV